MNTEAAQPTPRHKPSPVRTHRVVLGLTQQQVADAAGVSVMQLRRLERGECRPTLDTANAIARALGAPVEAIFPNR